MDFRFQLCVNMLVNFVILRFMVAGFRKQSFQIRFYIIDLMSTIIMLLYVSNLITYWEKTAQIDLYCLRQPNKTF